MNKPTSFINGKLVLLDQVVETNLRVENGLIASIGEDALNASDEIIDLKGDYLMPGLVEIHTDNLERHLMPRPKVYWEELPALLAHDAEITASGITTVFDALGVGEADTDSLRGSAWSGFLETLAFCETHQLLRADHHLHVRCELPAPNTIELFKPFHNHPKLSLVSLMDHTPGQRQWENIEAARTYYTGKKGWSQEKFERQVSHAPVLQAQYAQPHRAYFVDYCQTHGISLASHDDTTQEHVLQAAQEGACISEFPTSLLAAKTAHENNMLNVMGGPNVVRGGSHSGNVAAIELARQGLLDILSSDYVPSSLLAAVMRLVDEGVCSLPQALATVTHNPAKATGLKDRGSLAVGLRADLVQAHFVKISSQKTHAIVKSSWRLGKRVI
jgi:alpha-D-ribose 1-methylphosphonate 5-triphosphate diphosphatase